MQRRGIAWAFSEHCGDLSNCKAVLRLPVQLIIGDCQGHDKLCGRYNSHGQNIKGLCRDCDIPTKKADNVDWQCSYRTSTQLARCTEAELTNISFYNIDNALDTLCFGSTRRGFFAALLAENLHVLRSGLFPMIFDGLWSSLSQKGKDYLHGGAQFFVNIHKSLELQFQGIPPINAFRNGLTAEKAGGTMQLDAKEKHGRLLYILLSCSPT